jgi:hypothetical protein
VHVQVPAHNEKSLSISGLGSEQGFTGNLSPLVPHLKPELLHDKPITKAVASRGLEPGSLEQWMLRSLGGGGLP